jgi:glutamate dehydrogenase (NAD(P)+)
MDCSLPSEACAQVEEMKTLGISPGIEGKRVAIQGLGNVGYHAANFCREAGAIIIAIAECEGGDSGFQRTRYGATPQ